VEENQGVRSTPLDYALYHALISTKRTFWPNSGQRQAATGFTSKTTLEAELMRDAAII
jgi:hypothetical protein